MVSSVAFQQSWISGIRNVNIILARSSYDAIICSACIFDML